MFDFYLMYWLLGRNLKVQNIGKYPHNLSLVQIIKNTDMCWVSGIIWKNHANMSKIFHILFGSDLQKKIVFYYG